MSPKFLLGSLILALGIVLFSNGKLNRENIHPAFSWFFFSWGKTTIILATLCVIAGSAMMLFIR